MAEHGAAPAPQAASLEVTIDAQYRCDPQHGEVNNSGEVYFNVSPSNGCLIHTSPAQAFEDESSNGYITLDNGRNGPYVPLVDNQTITYCACASGSTCDPFTPKQTGGNTIKVGSGPVPHSK